MIDETPELLIATRALLEKHRGRWMAVSVATRVSHSWMSKLARGEINNPTIVPLQRLHDHLLSLDSADKAAAA